MSEAKNTASEAPELIDLLICDDVREENDGRYTLMGIFPGREIATRQMPTVLNQLALVLRFRGLGETLPLFFNIESPDGKKSQAVRGRRLESQTAEGDALFVIVASPLQITHTGKHTLRVKLGEHKYNTAFLVSQLEA